MSGGFLKNNMRQEQKLMPQLLQSLQLLQMNGQELLEYLTKAGEENPLLELEDSKTLQQEYEELRSRAGWLDACPQMTSFYHENPGTPEWGAEDQELESLAAFLRDQLDRLHLPEKLLALCRYLVEITDENGWLDSEYLNRMKQIHIPADLIEQALGIVQKLDPPGVCARSLPECLLLQMNRMENISQSARDIVLHFLPELGKKHYGAISRTLGISIEEVRAAEKVIASLDPHPCRTFQAEELPSYICPDIFVVNTGKCLQVVLNKYYLPRITISKYYEKLLKQSDTPEIREYLREKIKQARWLLDGLERRGSTLRYCASAVLEAQRAFFEEKTDSLTPMSIGGLSDQLGLNISTVSRAISGKYLQCKRGTYPLRFFFSSAVGNSDTSRQAVQQKIRELIRTENPSSPFSDEQISKRLSEQGIYVARRTVAKYRTELGIPSSTARRNCF